MKRGIQGRRSVCAFANDFPNNRRVGIIFVGARDDGTDAGLAITDELLQQLANIRDDGRVLPFPSLTVERRSLNGFDVAIMSVSPSRDAPIRYDGRTWIRVDPQRG